MKNIGVAAMVVGILVFVLAIIGVLGEGGSLRTVTVAAIVIVAIGFLLYRRGKGQLG
jgi:hypothetical protein